MGHSFSRDMYIMEWFLVLFLCARFWDGCKYGYFSSCSLIINCQQDAFYLFLKNIYLLIWMSDRERERRREIFHLLIDFPNSPYSQSWARQKPESRIKISLWSFQMGDRRSDTWPSSTAFLGALAGSRIGRGATRAWTGDPLGCQHSIQQPNLCRSTVPYWHFLMLNSWNILFYLNLQVCLQVMSFPVSLPSI